MRPVRAMVLAISFAASLIATVVMGGASMALALDSSVGNLEEHAAYMAEALASASIDQMFDEAYVSLEGTVREFEDKPNVDGAYIADTGGRIVASLEPKLLGMDARDAYPGAVVRETGHDGLDNPNLAPNARRSMAFTLGMLGVDELVWSWPIDYNGLVLGEASIVLSLDGVRERVSWILWTGAVAGLVAFAAASAIALPLALGVTTPIERLTVLAKRVEAGESPGEPPPSGIREVSVLARSMCDMAISLAARNAATEQARSMASRARDEAQASANRLEGALYEKTVLLREVHHRVKNNLQVIMSLLHLQMDSMRDPYDKAAQEQSLARIRSMSLVHEMLYQSEDLAHIDLRDYLQTLCEDSIGNYHDLTAVFLVIEVPPISMGIDEAVPLGLIVNELATNALKHAFPGRPEGTLRLTMTESRDPGSSGCNGAEVLILEVADDGVGSPAGQAPVPALGLTLVGALVSQLEGSATWDWNDGCRFRLCFPRRAFYP